MPVEPMDALQLYAMRMRDIRCHTDRRKRGFVTRHWFQEMRYVYQHAGAVGASRQRLRHAWRRYSNTSDNVIIDGNYRRIIDMRSCALMGSAAAADISIADFSLGFAGADGGAAVGDEDIALPLRHAPRYRMAGIVSASQRFLD